MQPGTPALQLREERKRRMMKERTKTRRTTTTSREEELRLDERERLSVCVCVFQRSDSLCQLIGPEEAGGGASSQLPVNETRR